MSAQKKTVCGTDTATEQRPAEGAGRQQQELQAALFKLQFVRVQLGRLAMVYEFIAKNMGITAKSSSKKRRRSTRSTRRGKAKWQHNLAAVDECCSLDDSDCSSSGSDDSCEPRVSTQQVTRAYQQSKRQCWKMHARINDCKRRMSTAQWALVSRVFGTGVAQMIERPM